MRGLGTLGRPRTRISLAGFLLSNEQKMSNSVLYLRLSYWIAATADFANAVLMWIPERLDLTETVNPGGLASVIACSRGVLLLMANRNPIERKWILIPSILVVTLIADTRTMLSLDGTIEFSLLPFLFAVALIYLMAYSHFHTSKHANHR